jgi:hypothetical protein
MSKYKTNDAADINEEKQAFVEQVKRIVGDPTLLRDNAVFPRHDFESFIHQAGLVNLIAERFCKNQFYGKFNKQIIESVKEYIHSCLPDALYIITSETIVKALAYATGESPSKPKIRALSEEAAKQIQRRDRKLVLGDSRGAPETWDKHKLITVVQEAIKSIKNSALLTQNKVAKQINVHYNPDPQLTASSLRQLLKRKGLNWKELKAQRAKEIIKRT